MSLPESNLAQPLTSKQSGPLKGRVRPPGDKSISHRAFLFGLLTRGVTEIEGLLEGDDVLRTSEACKALGRNRAQGCWALERQRARRRFAFGPA